MKKSDEAATNVGDGWHEGWRSRKRSGGDRWFSAVLPGVARCEVPVALRRLRARSAACAGWFSSDKSVRAGAAMV
jgi:hypothetical protein